MEGLGRATDLHLMQGNAMKKFEEKRAPMQQIHEERLGLTGGPGEAGNQGRRRILRATTIALPANTAACQLISQKSSQKSQNSQNSDTRHTDHTLEGRGVPYSLSPKPQALLEGLDW